MPRIEDRRLLSGGGRYTDDLTLPGLLHMSVVRSPVAAARIRSLEAAAARAISGVVDVLVAADIGPMVLPPERGHPGMRLEVTPPVLAGAEVRYVGEPLAAVVAEDPYLAEDGAEAIAAEYDPLPATPDLEAALASGAPRVHSQLPDNVAGYWRYETGDAAGAFSAAPVRVALRVCLNRGHGSPLETRGCLARYDQSTGELTVWAGHQSPHRLRDVLAQLCSLPADRVRVISPDVGGGFGLKGRQYPEYVLAALFAIRTGRPVKWIEDRREHFLATTPDREILHEIELAATRDGVVLAIRDRFWADLGAYAPMALQSPQLCVSHLCGPYRIRNIDIEAYGVFTHRTPTGAYRGFGRPNGTFAIERAMDRLAETLALDPIELRQKNLIQPAEMPWSVGLSGPGMAPLVYDSGDYPALLAAALAGIDYPAMRREQAEARRQGRYLGIGVACFVEGNAGGPETVTLRLEASGRVRLVCGAPDIGQGAGSTWAHLVARILGIATGQVDVVAGDTGEMHTGTGTFGSRTAVVVGNAAAMAATALAERVRDACAQLLECAAEDVELVAGAARVRGVPERQLLLAELARRVESGAAAPSVSELEVSRQYKPDGQTWAAGVHAVVLEVDPATAAVQIRRFVAADDCGHMLQPQLVEGQIVGGVVQAIGGSLYEHLAYSAEGQPLTATLMDYLLPTAGDVPPIEVLHHDQPSPVNPLGVKGAGESGCMGAYAAIAAALEDALLPTGGRVNDLPMLPNRIFALLAQPRGTRTAAE